MSVFKSSAIFAASILGAAQIASAAPYSFQDGVNSYDGTQDVSLYTYSWTDDNTGGSTVLWLADSIYGARGLLKFDVSSLAGLTVTGTPKITLRVADTSLDDPATINYSIYAVSDANAAWQQGDNGFSAADPGEADWNHLSHPGTAWAGSPGLLTAGTDYNATPVQTGTFSQLPASEGTAFEITLSASLVQHWIDVANGGLLIVHDGGYPGAMQFYSSEASTTSSRPILEVEAIPEPASGALLLGAGMLALRRRK